MLTFDREEPWPDGEGGVVDCGANSFHDGRGSIHNLIEHECGSVAVIRSKPNTVRSNHWHRRDAHYLWTLEGRWLYQECGLDEDLDSTKPIEVNRGEMVYTPPGRIHRTTFLTQTTLVSMSKLPRTHENHEKDVVRLEVA